MRVKPQNQGEKPWTNLLETLEVDQVWVSDITYVRLKGRFIYVCLLMIFHPDDQSVAAQSALDKSLTLKPLKEALCHSVPDLIPIKACSIFPKAYITTLEEHGVEISVAHRGRPWENGYAERLIRTLKEEEVEINDYQNITEARDRIGHFIEQVYHQKRPHSALGYLTPMEFQQQTLS